VAFERGDFDALYASLDPEIEWLEPELEVLPQAGRHRGVEAVVNNVLAAIPQTFERVEFNPDEWLHDDDTVTVLGRMTAKGHRRPEETFRFAQIWKLSDGKVVHFEGFVDTLKLARTLDGGESTARPAAQRH
jgi:ketosteroid isomerase-like protein